MEFRHQKLRQQLTSVQASYGKLAAYLTQVAQTLGTPGVLPADEAIGKITSTRKEFDEAVKQIHALAAEMMVSPLAKPEELTHVSALESLLAQAGTAEEARHIYQDEKAGAIAALTRALAISHRDGAFAPLAEYQAKLTEMKKAIEAAAWPSRHPEASALAADSHDALALLTMVANRDAIDDDKWIVLEETVTKAYGKPLAVAASRGKLEVSGAPKPVPAVAAATKPADVKPVEAKSPDVKPVEVKPVEAKKEEPKPETVKPVEAPAPAAVAAPIPVPAAPPAAATAEAKPAAVAAAKPVIPAEAKPVTAAEAKPVTAEVKPVIAEVKPVAAPVVAEARPVVVAEAKPVTAEVKPVPVVEAKPLAVDLKSGVVEVKPEPATVVTMPAKAESKTATATAVAEKDEKTPAMAGDRPQRWGFWRGNR